MPLDGREVIFVIPHPDDETLSAGVSIAEHVAANRSVRILLATRGTNSGVFRQLNGVNFPAWWGVDHNPPAEGYDYFTDDAVGRARFGAARYQEFIAALEALGVPADRVYEASDLIGEPVLDSYVTQDQMERAIVALADRFSMVNPGLWTYSHTADKNPDHLNAGKASLALGQRDPVRWADRRYFMLPSYWNDTSLTNLVPGKFWDTPTDVTIKNRAINACRAYGAWSPRTGSFAIGRHSVSSLFDTVESNPKCYIHK